MNTEKTAIIFNQLEFGITYHIFDGDYNHLKGVYINGVHEEKLKDELSEIVLDKKGYAKNGKVSIDQFAMEIAAGAALIECGFYL